MKVKVKIAPPREVIRRLGMDVRGDVQRFWTATVLHRIQRYMPYRTGNLIKRTIANTDINTPAIVTPGPEVRTLFDGVSKNGKPLNYTRTKNPQAGPRWDKTLTAAEMPVMQQELQAYVDRRG